MNYRIVFLSLLILISCGREKISHPVNTNNGALLFFNDTEKILPGWSKENTVIYHTLSDPDNLHPTNGNSAPRSDIFFFTQRTLLFLDVIRAEIAPGLTEELPSVSDDGLTYSFKLRNIKWDNGQKLSSRDVLFSIKASLCPLTRNQATRAYWQNIDSVITDVADESIFKLKLRKRHIQNMSFLTSFTIMQQSFHDPENVLSNYSLSQFRNENFNAQNHSDLALWAAFFNDDSFGRNTEKLNGLGRYKVEKWEPGQYISLTRKPATLEIDTNIHPDLALPERIIFQINKDDASQLLNFRSGKIDVSTHLSLGTFINLSHEEDFHQNYNYALINTYNFSYLCFNTKPDGIKRKKIFEDARVRKALALNTPVDDLKKIVYKEYEDKCVRLPSMVSPLKNEYDSSLSLLPFDTKSAMKLLSDAGWKDSDSDGVLDKIIDGRLTPMVFDLLYLSSSSDWKDMAMMIREKYEKLGVRVNPVMADIKRFIESARSHDFDLLLGSWGSSSLADDYTQLFHTSSWQNNGSNYSGFGDEKSDALIDSIKYELNDSLRIAMVRRLQRIIYNDQPMVFLFSGMRRNVVHKRWGNLIMFPDRPGILLNTLRLLSINRGITMEQEVIP